jgi:DNA-binding response OmpR family regulator
MTQSQHIIIVDDEAPAREMVGEYLKMHGFTVTLCDGGKSLRGAIETSVPDLVVLDLNMPEEDGLSIIRDLRAAPTSRSSCSATRTRSTTLSG